MNRKSIESLFDLQFDCSKKILRACLFFDLIVAILDQDQQVHISIFALHIKISKPTKANNNETWTWNLSKPTQQELSKHQIRKVEGKCSILSKTNPGNNSSANSTTAATTLLWEGMRAVQNISIFQYFSRHGSCSKYAQPTALNNVQMFKCSKCAKQAAGIFATSSWFESSSWNF